jgi:beta-lactamase regulating signal transducer with metallopeptidase domain
MNALWQTITTSSPIRQLGWTLIHSIWLGALAALALAAAQPILRRRSANARYGAACAAMLFFITATASAYFFTASPAAPAAVSSAIQQKQTITAGPPTNPIQPIPQSPAAPFMNNALATAIPAPESFWPRFSRTLNPALPYLSTTWLAGVALIACWQISAWLGVRKIKRTATPLTDATTTTQLLDDLAQLMNIRRPIPLLQSARVNVPTLIGYLAPAVLLPAGLVTGLSPDQLRAILAHELAHVRRHDYLVNLLQTIAQTLFFFHPAAWYISARMRFEREACCDDLVIHRAGAQPADYAQSLLTIARRAISTNADLPATLALAAVGNPSDLRRRVQRLLNNEQKPTRFATAWPIPFLLIAAVTTALLHNRAPFINAAEKTPATRPAATPPAAPKWGQPSSGLRSRIIADKQSFRAGEPIPVKIEMQNIGQQPVQYQTPAAPYNASLTVLDQRGQPVPYLGGASQVMVRTVNVDPGKTVEAKSFDLADWYYLRRPGRYTVLWPGEIRVAGPQDETMPPPLGPPSAPFEFDVTPDQKLATADGDPIARLLPLLQKNWWLAANNSAPKPLNPGANYAQVTGRFIALEYHPTGYKNDSGLVSLWLTDQQAGEQPVTATWPPASTYLGLIDRWYVYIHADPNAIKAWPTANQDISKALALAAPGDASKTDTPKNEKAPTPSDLQIRLVAEPDDKSGEADEIRDPDHKDKPLRVLKPILLDGRDILRAYRAIGQPSVGIDLTDAGGEKLKKITTDNINHRLAIIVDGKLLSAPTIRTTITKSLVITAGQKEFTPEKVDSLINIINNSRPKDPDKKPD